MGSLSEVALSPYVKPAPSRLACLGVLPYAGCRKIFRFIVNSTVDVLG